VRGVSVEHVNFVTSCSFDLILRVDLSLTGLCEVDGVRRFAVNNWKFLAFDYGFWELL
jgi:hypothetical protein